ncbi:hypothetical protein NCC78_05500 [Micromonospora phytophila]|uniref:hypothetical protein n=1 Tax=Micromonospora phytophila TaxID=709888 RepID=UPI00202EAE3E|nr:hypothetical protein [Micromonospora phytophila]MCM0674151.1 hypothetical protein [Micromonospora phytophila]
MAVLDTLAPLPPPANPKPRQRSEPLFWQPANRDRTRRAENLAAWHLMLIDRLMGSDAEDCLDRLASHPALDGPEHTFLRRGWPTDTVTWTPSALWWPTP